MKPTIAVTLLLAAALFASARNSITGYGGNYLIDVARGDVQGVSAINKFGRNDDIDTGSVPETVWSHGGVWVPPTAARTHAIVSSDVADAAAGTGARTIRIFGLDSAWAEQTEDITMNGTTPVNTASTYTRIFRMYVLTSGSGEKNAGTITATAATDGTVTAEIPVGESQTQMAVWTVPAGKTIYMVAGFISLHRPGSTADSMVDSNLYGTFGLDTATPTRRLLQSLGMSTRGTSMVNYQWNLPKTITGPCDLEIVVTYVTDNNMKVSAGFDGIYEDSP